MTSATLDSVAAEPTVLPLSHVRVVDLSMGWAGPLAARHLADMGAEVVKVEACSHMDWWRGWDAVQADIDAGLHEQRPAFNAINRNKLGITLELASEEGKALLKRLVAQADIVIENYAASVLPKLGLDYPVLSAVNPAIVMVSMPAFGGTGPWSGYRAYGSTVEHASGLPHLNGEEHWPPAMQHIAYGDPLAGITGAAAALAALWHRQQTGEGQHVDLAQVEALFPYAAHGLITQSMLGQKPARTGSRRPDAAPRGCFRCRGEDRWLAIAVDGDAQWQALCHAIGRPDLAADERLAGVAGRKAHEAEIEAALSAWAAERTAPEAAALLLRAGVPAAPANSAPDLLEDPHLGARQVWQQRERPFAGKHWMKSPPYRYGAAPLPIRNPAPTLGQDTRTVLTRLLGLSAADLDGLETRGIIGTRPVPATAAH